MTSGLLDISVVIPHRNRADLLRSVLACLAGQTPAVAEVIVVDNGSTDESAAVAEEFAAVWLPQGRNRGFAAAVNEGIRHASRRWVGVLNNDISFGPRYLPELVQAAEAGEAPYATGKLLQMNHPDRLDGSFDLTARSACSWRAGHGRPDGGVWNEARVVYSAPMTAAIFRRDLFELAGLLDETFGSYLEDVDFGLRCYRLGFTGIYVPSAVAFHAGSQTLGARSAETVRLISRNQVLLYRKHFRDSSLRAAIGQLLWGLAALRDGRFFAWLGGKFDGFRLTVAPEPGPPAAPAILEMERQISALQASTGWDTYWRIYRRMVGLG
jgi:GT2 family glycosyltransferase